MKRLSLLCVCFFAILSLQAQIPTNGLVAWYPFNGNANDESGNGLNGIVNNAILTNDRFGNADKAYDFNGSDSYIKVLDNNLLDIPNTQSLTISFWIKHDNSSTNINVYIISKYSGLVSSGAAFACGTWFYGDAYSWTQISPGNENGMELRGNADIHDNNWHHFVYIWENGIKAKIIIDNILDTSKTWGLTGSVINDIDLYFGCGANLAQFYKGSLDDIHIYNRALNDAEIQALFTENSNSSGYGISNTFIFDTKSPVVTLQTPNGGQTFNASQPINVKWSATDELWGNNPISIAIKTSSAGNYQNLVNNIPNNASKSVQPPCISTNNARIRVTAKDLYGNIAIDTSDNWISLTGGGPPTTISLSDIQTATPLNDAVITASGGSSQYLSSPSGVPGQYIIYIPVGSGYNLSIAAPGYQTKEVKNISIVANVPGNLQYQMSQIAGFTEYRIMPGSLVPNPLILEIPEGGFGYAWFVVEGLLNGSWLPVPNINLTAQDEQGNVIDCQTNILSYNFLSSAYHMQNAGVFSVKIPSSMIENGAPGDQETFTVITAKGSPLPVANRQSITAKVIPYTYSTSWDYRIYGKLGLGVGQIVSATGFVGGGSGSIMKVKLAGLSNNPAWSEFQISRRRDIFAGVNFEVGPPDIIPFLSSEIGLNAETRLSFPYQSDFSFNMNNLQGLESLLAFYLFYEPTILFAGTTIPGGVMSAQALSWMVEAIIANSAQNGLGINRFADETGLNLSQSASANIQMGLVSAKSFGISVGPSIGLETNIGGTLRKESNTDIKRFYMSGKYDVSLDIGPKWIPNDNFKIKNLYPFRLMNTVIPTSLGIDFEGKYISENSTFQSFLLTCGVESNSPVLNIHNLGGQRQKYNAWFSIDDEYVRNILFNASQLPSQISSIGNSAIQLIGNSNTFEQMTTGFLNTVYNEQNNNKPAKLKFGYDASCNSYFELNLDLDIPIPLFPAISFNIGGGAEGANSTEYKISEGYWLKGLPYLQTEMPNPPNPQLTFNTVMTTLWAHVKSGQTLSQLQQVIVPALKNGVIKWLGWKSLEQTVPLNLEGSTLKINAQSIPSTVDSVTFKHWEWTNPVNNDRIPDPEKQALVLKYANTIKKLRQVASGLTFGIGGFYAFEPKGNNFGDSTLITIAYPDSVVMGIDESKLAVFREDTLGIWHYIPSNPMPDSNRVSAYIHHFTNYTLAPILPHGNYGFDFTPDSIPANGISTATVMSDLMFNADSTIIPDSTVFTVKVSRGKIVSPDIDTTLEGTQIRSLAGKIQFVLKADTIANPVTIIGNSREGHATLVDTLFLYDITPPEVPWIVSAIPVDGAIIVKWDTVPSSDLAGYKVYYDADTLIPPYNGVANVWGSPSPVNVGMTNSFRLAGLSNYGEYYIAMTAFDIKGNESAYSIPVTVMLNPPPSTFEISSDTINGSNSECYNASDTLKVAGNGKSFVVNSGGDVSMIAGKLISFLPGTKVKTGGVLHASITQDELFCNRINQTTIASVMEIKDQDIINGEQKCYNATKTLLVAGNGSTVAVRSGGSANFIAGEQIRFLPGFSADSGGYVHGYITTDGQFCSMQGDHLILNDADNNDDKTLVQASDKSFFRLYPNPTSGDFTLSLSSINQDTRVDIFVYNLLGNEVLHEYAFTKTQTVSTQNLPAGIYLVKVVNYNEAGTMKLIKQ